MPITAFNPAAGNFGEQYICSSRTLPTAVIAAGTTVRHLMPIVAAEVPAANQTEILFYKGGALNIGGTAPSFTLATTARVVKRNAGGVITPLSAPVTIANGQAQFSVLSFPLLPTATEAERTIRPNAGDNILIEVTNAATGTVTTQPGDVQVGLKLAVLR